MVRFKAHNDGVKGYNAIWFYQVPKVYNPLQISLGDGTTPGPTTFVGKSRLSVALRVD
ncbi:hypothetical protein MTR_7g046055 [Medicago truncatula]|uniref:Uncharacterized protein n=1 Tax=Medicago truncatula TaxID=3880 RepID=A0A072TZY6_MEDTR|nr:hypothetical protein MTR_7g046055 [Medicago truncatula]